MVFLAWLKDKLEGNKFAFPALYQPASLIPIDIWKGSSLSTNSGEQQHRNIYRDGVNLTMLAGVMRGMQFDWRTMASINLYRDTGIHYRDQPATHAHRIAHSVSRHGKKLHMCSARNPHMNQIIIIPVHVQRRTIEQAGPSISSDTLPPPIPIELGEYDHKNDYIALPDSLLADLAPVYEAGMVGYPWV